MAAKRKSTSTKRAKPEEGSLDDRLHGIQVLLESMERQNKATIEAVFAMRGELVAMFEKRFSAIERRLDALEAAVRQNSEDIRQNSEDIRKNSADIAALREELERTNRLLEAKAQASALAALEKRVELLEQQARS